MDLLTLYQYFILAINYFLQDMYLSAIFNNKNFTGPLLVSLICGGWHGRSVQYT